MKIKVDALEGIALDWTVARCEGYLPDSENALLLVNAGIGQKFIFSGHHPYRPGESWNFGGPIIERERIAIRFYSGGIWFALPSKLLGDGKISIWNKNRIGERYGVESYKVHRIQARFQGSTALLAAMRCYVASKLGEEVEVPDELVSP